MEHELVLIAGGALAITITAAVFARRTGVAAPLLLVALGIATSYIPATPTLHFEPELILTGVLPLLLYASAIQLPVLDIRRNLALIGWLSVVLVVVSAVLIGLLVHWVFPFIPLPLGIALGAVVSPTDAVAATAIGRRVGLPPRVMTVLEGESLVNDASALVMLRTALAALAATGSFSPVHTVLDFGWAVLAAVVIGGLVGWASVLLRQRLDDPVLNTTISFAVPFAAYFPAEEMHASGVLAVVVAGVLAGSMASKRLSARDRQTQATTWATINFVLESGVFLAMGYQLPQVIDAARADTTAGQLAGMVLLVVVALIALRFAGLLWPVLTYRYGPDDRSARVLDQLTAMEQRIEDAEPRGEREENRLAWARRRLARSRADVAFEEREPLGARSILVIAWAGMRGVVTVAAAQTIPIGTPYRDTVVLAAFLVALVTLVVFGLSLPALIRRLDFAERSPEERRDAMLALVKQIGEDATDSLGPLAEQTVDGEPLDPELVRVLEERLLPQLITMLESPARRLVQSEQAVVIQRRYLDAMRDALLHERSIGGYSSQTFRQVEKILDRMEQRLGAQ